MAELDKQSTPAGVDVLPADREPASAIKQGGSAGRDWFRPSAAFLTSMVTHMVAVLALALWVMPTVTQTAIEPLTVRPLDEPIEDLETVVLDEQVEAATEMVFGDSGGQLGPLGEAPEFSDVQVEQELLEAEVSQVTVDMDSVLTSIADTGELFSEVTTGTLQRSRSVVDGYGPAMDRITQEILQLLYDGPVLVVWCFDESGSMKDDQQEIRDRIERVYEELGLSDRSKDDLLATAITSFGQGFHVHTEIPTSDLEEIRRAINAVPQDDSGVERMCQAVGESIGRYQRYVNRTRRRMVLILVSDESGDPANNLQFLEPTIRQAKDARCKIYALGREACFGYPYVFFRYKHPQTERIHWLRVQRGPETAFVEQIQTNGFYRRHDAFPSGFGPYEQSRMCYETNGIFFLLPSLESNLVRGQKRRYELDAMKWYHPDLRPRREIFAERDRHELRTTLWGIISDLNPYNPQSAKVIELRDDWSLDPAVFSRQVVQEQTKAKIYLIYLLKAIERMEAIRPLREKEESRRWRANYDLLHGQLLAYAARVNEFGVYLDYCMQNPKSAPPTKAPNLYLRHWELTTRKELLTAEVVQPYIDRANEIFAQLEADHPGTPWAARAKWERNRGYGVDLYPYYEPPYKEVANPTPLPKL